MISDITLGQYFPGTSPLHKLDPRIKAILSVLYMVAVFCAKNLAAFAYLLIVTILLVVISRISVRVIMRSLRPILIVLLFTAVLNVFFTKGEGDPLFSWWIFTAYTEGLWRAAFMAVRVVLLIAGVSILLTYTTSPIALTDALESLFSPLKLVHAPVHEFAMMMTIALRFIPTLIEETDKIMKAQKSRGADFTSGGLIRRAKSLIPVLVPLFVSSFQHAMDLATAMECRCYRGGEGRTKLNELVIHFYDVIVLVVGMALLCAVFVANRALSFGYSL